MARTLLESVQKQLEAPAEQPGMQDEGQQVQTLLRAKLGKAAQPGTGATPVRSALQEKQAVQQTKLGGEQLQQAGRLASAQIGQQAEQQRVEEVEKSQNLLERRKDLEQDFELKSQQIYNDLVREGKRLDTEQQVAKLEQLGFMTRLQNEQYVNQLQIEGQRARLDDSLKFKEALTRANFEDRQDLIDNQQFLDSMINASQREYEEELGAMTNKYAYEAAKKELEAERRAGMFSGASSAISGGIGAAYSKSEEPPA